MEIRRSDVGLIIQRSILFTAAAGSESTEHGVFPCLFLREQDGQRVAINRLHQNQLLQTMERNDRRGRRDYMYGTQVTSPPLLTPKD